MGTGGGSWDRYVEQFHSGRPGVTESLLARSVDDTGDTAYDWACADLPGGVVLDVGCGSGPTWRAGSRWVGLDRSRAELDVARGHGRGPLVSGSAAALPVRSGWLDVVMATMSLMVVDDPPAVVAEVMRVLRPGGVLRVLLPSDVPLTNGDRARYGLLLALLGRRSLPFPRPELAAEPGRVLEAAGLEVVSDERRRFRFPVGGRRDVDLFVESLYLPGIDARRVRAARYVLGLLTNDELGIPLRRVEARRVR